MQGSLRQRDFLLRLPRTLLTFAAFLGQPAELALRVQNPTTYRYRPSFLLQKSLCWGVGRDFSVLLCRL